MSVERGVTLHDPYCVRVRLGASQGFYHSTAMLSGLCALARAGRIRLAVETKRRQRGSDVVMDMEVTRQGDARRVVCDLGDRSELFATDLLNDCDVYMKRSYFNLHVEALPAAARGRICPFGLNFAAASGLLSRRLAWCVGGGKIAGLVTDALGFTKDFGLRWNDLKNYLSLPAPREYEFVPAESCENTVLFQTRLWDREDVLPDDPEEVNATRVAVTRALKRAFGDRFQGGLVPTPYAVRHYPDLITNLPCYRRSYIARSRSAPIAVYTRGLHHSIAFKLPEYLASSKAIVADGFRNELPRPLEEGVNYLRFSDPEECVEQCRRLLRDAEFTARMRQANHEYYREEVEPSALVLNCLDRAFRDEAVMARRPRTLGATNT